MKTIIKAIIGFFAKIAVSFGQIFNKGNPSANPAGKGTGNEARPRKRLVDGVDADRFTRLCVVVVIGFVSLIGAILLSVSLRSGGHRIAIDEQEGQGSTSTGRLTIALGGDIRPTQGMLDAALTDSGYNFQNDIAELADAMAGDLSLVGLCGQVDVHENNQETGGYGAGFNYPAELANALSEMGVNDVFGANQFAFANGYDGMCAHVSNMHKHSMGVVGLTNTDTRKLNTSLLRINGVSIGLAGYNCVNSSYYNALSDEQKTYMVQLSANPDSAAEKVAADIAAMKNGGAEFVVICLNWGDGMSFTRTEFITQAAEKIAKAGADVIVGYGPHVTMDARIIRYEADGKQKECYVFYSLGDLFADTYIDVAKYADNKELNIPADVNARMCRSMTVQLDVARNADGEVSVELARYNPIYIIKNPGSGEENSHLKYMAVPSGQYISAEQRPAIFATDAQWQQCNAAFRAICAQAEAGDAKLVLNGVTEEAPVSSETPDGKI